LEAHQKYFQVVGPMCYTGIERSVPRMNTQNKPERKKSQRQKTGHRQVITKKQNASPEFHNYLGNHEQEHPETRMTR
jgi:hypothetical protein